MFAQQLRVSLAVGCWMGKWPMDGLLLVDGRAAGQLDDGMVVGCWGRWWVVVLGLDVGQVVGCWQGSWMSGRWVNIGGQVGCWQADGGGEVGH